MLKKAAEEPRMEGQERSSFIIAGREVQRDVPLLDAPDNSTALVPNKAAEEPKREGQPFPAQAKTRAQKVSRGRAQKPQERGDQVQKSSSPTVFKEFQAYLSKLCGRKERQPAMVQKLAETAS